VTETTRNAGAAAAAASSTAFYLSANTILDAGDVKLQPSRLVATLAPNAFSTATTTLTLPNVPAGTWYVFATADDAKSVLEASEINNTRFATVRVGPDLTFLSVAVPSTGVAGASITVASDVRNAGAADAPPSVVRFYLSTNMTFDASDIPLNAARAIPALLPLGTNSGTTVVGLPPNTTGTFYLLLVADADKTVPESSELNNLAARLITITGG
nr:hypothetical protein [Acidobacteriota bacterium]